MTSNLYLIQNIMIFMEECLVRIPSDQDAYTINPHYVRNPETFASLQKDIVRLYPALRYVRYEDICGTAWDRVYMSSYVPDDLLPFYAGVNAAEIVLVEDGLFDYVPAENGYAFYKGKRLYMFRPELASSTAKAASVCALDVTDEVVGHFASIYEEDISKLSHLNPKTPVLFTTPFGEDFGADDSLTVKIVDYIIRVFGFDQIVLKRHPRDEFVYTSDSMEIIECPKNIPGQLLDKIFDGKKIFLFPSTVSFMCGELSDIVFVNVLPDNRGYSDPFNAIVGSELFKKQEHIKVMTM